MILNLILRLLFYEIILKMRLLFWTTPKSIGKSIVMELSILASLLQ